MNVEGWNPHMGNTSEPAKSQPISVFYSYVSIDEDLRRELETHLSLLQKQRVISGWHQRKILAGSDWQDEVDRHLIEAQVILLLISVDFLASDYCYSVELKRALERHRAGEARVIPILLRPVFYESAPFSMLKMLPRDNLPITKWGNRDEAWVDVVRALRLVFADLSRTPPVVP